MYEKDVNATWKVLTRGTERPTESRHLFPHLDNRHYIISLAEYIAASPPEVLIVGGPKDSGKTTGLVYMANSARKLGHEVFKLNLKSSNVKGVMSTFADSFVDLIEGITDIKRLACIYQRLLNCPSIRAAEQETISITFKAIISTIYQSITYLLTAVTLGVIPIFVWNQGWHKLRYWIISIGIGMAVIVYALFSNSPILRYKAISLASDVRENIADSNWDEIFCCLNAIGSCDYYKPILTINDVKNFGKENLNNFFQALQVVKDLDTTGESHFPTSKPRFPVILETSDNIWMEGLYSGTSNSAFQFYYLEPMSKLEGKHAMVTKNKLT